MDTTYINLTPHPIKLIDDDGEQFAEFAPSGEVARLAEEVTDLQGACFQGEAGVIKNVNYGNVTGLGEPTPGTVYIVPLMVALAMKGQRSDLVFPYDQARNSEGTVIGCGSLARTA